MKIINPTFKFNEEINGQDIIKHLEKSGRVRYKSEDKVANGSDVNFISNIIKLGDESVLEHEKIAITITCDRGVSHEIVRHRIASYSQESTCYCNYTNEKFGNELCFIKPCFWTESDPKYDL